MLNRIKTYYAQGGSFFQNKRSVETEELINIELNKRPFRFNIINWILDLKKTETHYLEIGVRNPEDNFNKINATYKISVDPGIEFKSNPVDYKLTSDSFFDQLKEDKLVGCPKKFDLIFIDGLHTSEQVYTDIQNALLFLKDNGHILLHDCNPPNEFFAREDYYFDLTPAKRFWNGTTWKAFYRSRIELNVKGFCIDTDWGIGILQKNDKPDLSLNENPFYEFAIFSKERKNHLNLMSFDKFKSFIND